MKVPHNLDSRSVFQFACDYCDIDLFDRYWKRCHEELKEK